MTDSDRFPLIDDAGRQLLHWLQEHPHAPRYNHFGVDRLSADGLQRVQAFEAALSQAPNGWPHDTPPAWLSDFAQLCYDTVPFYRRHGTMPTNFFDIPTCDRGDLSREPWAFVPDTQSLDGLTVYQTSGTTGHPLDIITHPETLATYLPLMRFALATRGVTLGTLTSRVAIALICFQQSTFTYTAVSAYLNHAGLVKINFGLPNGTEVRAAHGGYATRGAPGTTYGNYIDIDHGNGFRTRYAHLSSFEIVNGVYVTQGQLIGKAGDSGVSGQFHLHFAAYFNGAAYMPEPMSGYIGFGDAFNFYSTPYTNNPQPSNVIQQGDFQNTILALSAN